jgi:hypothetical protein
MRINYLYAMLDLESTEDCGTGTAVRMLWCNGMEKTAQKVIVTSLENKLQVPVSHNFYL